MAGEVIPKLEQVLEKLENLERYVKAVDEKVSNLQAKVACFESFKNEKEKTLKFRWTYQVRFWKEERRR